jgi:prepilin-type N-terminal cleavage/methylation domain-containing protein
MIHRRLSTRGFSFTELLVVVSIIMVLSAIALPRVNGVVQSYRVGVDARAIASQLTLARVRAGSYNNNARINFNSCSSTSYQLEIYNTGTSSYQLDTNTGVAHLSTGVTFGYGSISTPAGSQSTITNSPCYVIFNSRGIPVDSSGNPTANYTIYVINNQNLCYAVTVLLSGRIQVWEYSGSAWALL